VGTYLRVSLLCSISKSDRKKEKGSKKMRKNKGKEERRRERKAGRDQKAAARH
jgi:hypothetical protein